MAVQSIKGSRYVPAAHGIGKTDYANANGTLTLANGATAIVAPYDGRIIAFSQRFVGTLDTGTLFFTPVIGGTVGTAFDGTVLPSAHTDGPTINFYVVPANPDIYKFSAGDTLQILVTKSGTVSVETIDSDGFLHVVYENVEY